jgi:hypothetical protein
MIRKTGICSLAATLVLLAGCASVQEAPLAQDAAAKNFSTSPDKGTLYIYRKPVLMWAKGQTAPITVDGVMITALRPGYFAVVKIVPGEHAITSATMDTLRVEVQAGKNYFVRENQTITGAWLKLMNETDGETEVKQCELLANLADETSLKPAPK